MKALRNLAGGFAGAVALNILHETLKHSSNKAPRVDLVGEEAIEKGSRALGLEPPEGDNIYKATLAGDIIANTIYYSAIGTAKKKHLIGRGILLGALAGLGAVKLTEPMGLDDKPVTKTDTTKVLTIAYYTFGGLVAAAVISALSGKSLK